MIPLVYDEMYNSANDNPIFSHEEYLIAAETESENLTALNEAMKRLSDRQREALSLKFENDRSYSDIAEIMEISIESARTLVYRALKELRKCFKNECQFIQVLFFLYRHPNP